MKRSKIICLSLGVIFCALFDLSASYMYYLSNPTYFIIHEANQEAVQFFVKGSIPMMFILSIVGYPIAIIVSLWWFDHYKEYFANNSVFSLVATMGSYLFVFGMVFYCCSRISAGLTWYDGDTYIFNNVATIFHSIVMVSLTCAIGLMMSLYIKHIAVVRNKVVYPH
jgi:hypothetical protein